MADQIKLKAFVRIDGTGKVIPGGPIFQAHKPKVGKWRQINAKECCNSITPTTSTTTTQAHTSYSWLTKSAYLGSSSNWNWNACNNPDNTFTGYTAVNVTPLPPNTPIYIDAALTQLANGNGMLQSQAISINGYVYYVINGYTNPSGQGTPCSSVTTSTTSTSTTINPALHAISVYTQGGSSTSQLCPPGSEGTFGVSTLYSTDTIVIPGVSRVYTDGTGTTPLSGGGFYRKQVGQSVVWTGNEMVYDGPVVQISC
jgi:hypothetical protein